MVLQSRSLDTLTPENFMQFSAQDHIEAAQIFSDRITDLENRRVQPHALDADVLISDELLRLGNLRDLHLHAIALDDVSVPTLLAA
jgi:hypothetical protein